MEEQFQVGVICKTYNHSAYIEEAMNGFTMQQTSFPYVCCIIDDASTDGEAEIIRQYLKKNFDLEDKLVARHEKTEDYLLYYARHKTNRNCFFAVLCLKYNHYGKKSKEPYYEHFLNDVKYIAICEGDDFWIDEKKMQRQLDFLESQHEYSMTCCRAKLFSEKKQEYVGEKSCCNKSADIKVEDIILKGGGYIATCSLLFRKEIYENIPDYCRKCHVGDWPLQIMCAMKGKTFFLNETMAVYRVDNALSWTGKHDKMSYEMRLSGIKSEIALLCGFARDYPSYQQAFKEKVDNIIVHNVPIKYINKKNYSDYMLLFKNEIDNFDNKNKASIKQNSSLLFHVYRKIRSNLKMLKNA